jgi:hypothetical protein
MTVLRQGRALDELESTAIQSNADPNVSGVDRRAKHPRVFCALKHLCCNVCRLLLGAPAIAASSSDPFPPWAGVRTGSLIVRLSPSATFRRAQI